MWIDDQILENFKAPVSCKIFTPDMSAVVLGSGNDESKEINLEVCSSLSIPILRRYGGGGTVVLYPGCVVISLGCWVKDQFANNRYFSMINRAVISSLAKQWPVFSGLSQAGISDIVMGDKKVGGTSLFRSRNYLLYQASILVDLDARLIESVLRHPTKEPDYRLRRSHSDFLVGLSGIERNISTPQQVARALQLYFLETFKSELGEQLILPSADQFKSLEARLERSRNQAVASNVT